MTKIEQKTDLELIVACRMGEEAAWQMMMTRYERLLYYIAHRQFGLPAVDADDIVQMTFTMLLDSLDTFHAESNVKGWLSTVAKRNTWRLMRQRDREHVLEAVDVGESRVLVESLDGSAENPTIQHENTIWLHDGLQKMDARCRDLLFALYLEHNPASYQQIADRLNIRLGSIGPTRARCLAKLKEILES